MLVPVDRPHWIFRGKIGSKKVRPLKNLRYSTSTVKRVKHNNKYNIGQFIENIKTVDWNIFLLLQDTEAAYHAMYQIIVHILKKSPVKRKTRADILPICLGSLNH